jgi:hypothetical protein
VSAPPCPALAEFAAALRDPAKPAPAALRGVDEAAAARRFAVHRNNVAVALATALAANHPVTAALVGEDFFTAMAMAFFSEHPPTSPILSSCGEGFASWLECFPPVAGLPYLADVARLERAVTGMLEEDEEDAVCPDHIQTRLQAANAPGRFRLRLQPALRVLRFDHGVVSLWLAHGRDEAALAEVDVHTPEHCLLLPREDATAIVPVDEATAGFIRELADRGALDAAAQPWLGRADFDLAAALGLLIHHRVIVEWTFEEFPE